MAQDRDTIQDTGSRLPPRLESRLLGEKVSYDDARTLHYASWHVSTVEQ